MNSTPRPPWPLLSAIGVFFVAALALIVWLALRPSPVAAVPAAAPQPVAVAPPPMPAAVVMSGLPPPPDVKAKPQQTATAPPKPVVLSLDALRAVYQHDCAELTQVEMDYGRSDFQTNEQTHQAYAARVDELNQRITADIAGMNEARREQQQRAATDWAADQAANAPAPQEPPEQLTPREQSRADADASAAVHGMQVGGGE